MEWVVVSEEGRDEVGTLLWPRWVVRLPVLGGTGTGEVLVSGGVLLWYGVCVRCFVASATAALEDASGGVVSCVCLWASYGGASSGYGE